MAPSSFKKLGVAFAIASAGKVAADTYTLTDDYTADNFFEKFDFYVTTEDGADPTHGFVNYRNQADAESLGLISSSDGKIYIGPDANQTYTSKGKGRDSVRIMSKAKYNQGLMIAKFSHMPVQSCGSWPAFWSYGSPWLSSGEIDYYEGWNDLGSNVMALHTNKTIAGECLLTTTGVSAEVTTEDCDDQKVDESINQYVGTGCGVSDTKGVWGSTEGATFAMQWAGEHIKIWNWLGDKVPADITAKNPDPVANSDAWGQPQLLAEEANCDLASAFSNQQLVFNVDFCGDTAGNSVLWANTCSSKGDSCVDYVASNPEAFSETYFEIEGIQFYELGSGGASASVAASVSIGAPSASVTAATPSSSGLLGGIGSVLGSTLGVGATVDLGATAGVAATSDAAATADVAATADLTTPVAATSSHSHTTSFITGTATKVNEKGETTVVVDVATTICPVTAEEASASQSSVQAAASTPPAVVSAQTPATSKTAAIATTPVASPSAQTVTASVASAVTSQIHTTSFITSTATKVNEKGETTVVVDVATTICPVTASEASASKASASASGGSVFGAASPPVSVPTSATSETAAVASTPVASPSSEIASTPVASPSSEIASIPVASPSSEIASTPVASASTQYVTTSVASGLTTQVHTTSYITSTATKTNEKGETTVVVDIATTICPVTASESSVLAAASPPPSTATLSSTVVDATSTSTDATFTSTESVMPTPTQVHTTSYITGTSTKTNEKGETTVVVDIATTICPVTASESSVLAAASPPPPSTTTLSSTVTDTTSTSTEMETSTVYSTHTHTPSTTSSASPTTVEVDLSTTICPVTASGKSASASFKPSSSASKSVPLAAQSSSVPATSKTAALHTSSPVPLAAQSSVAPKQTTISRKPSSKAPSSSSAPAPTLEMATGTPTPEPTLTYAEETETLSVPSTKSSKTRSSKTSSSTSASSTSAEAVPSTTADADTAPSSTSSCAGIDCVHVQNSGGSKSTVGAGGFALAAIAGAMFLL